MGPEFPTHRFPTAESFHLSYSLNFFSTSLNFIEGNKTERLTSNASFRVTRHQFTGEFQPNRYLSVGAILAYDSAKLGDVSAELTKSALSDQRIFAEYRLIDEVGSSLGVALVAKFPGYNNPTVAELTASGDQSAILFGDGQTDLSMMATSELWFTPQIRSRFDIGYAYRTEKYAGEFPMLASLGFVTPKVEVDVRFRGNFTAGNDGESNGSVPQLQTAFAKSQYALAVNPWVLCIQPSVEVWVNPKWALDFDYTYSLIGVNSPNFQNFRLGVTYRWAQTTVRRPRTFQQVDIRTNQEEGVFQGESQGRKLEPKVEDPSPIIDEPSGEEVFN